MTCFSHSVPRFLRLPPHVAMQPFLSLCSIKWLPSASTIAKLSVRGMVCATPHPLYMLGWTIQHRRTDTIERSAPFMQLACLYQHESPAATTILYSMTFPPARMPEQSLSLPPCMYWTGTTCSRPQVMRYWQAIPSIGPKAFCLLGLGLPCKHWVPPTQNWPYLLLQFPQWLQQHQKEEYNHSHYYQLRHQLYRNYLSVKHHETILRGLAKRTTPVNIFRYWAWTGQGGSCY